MALLEFPLLQIIPISCLNISFIHNQNYPTLLFFFFFSFAEKIFFFTEDTVYEKGLLKKIITRNKSVQTYISFRLYCQLLFDSYYFIPLFIGLTRPLLLSLEAKIVLLRADQSQIMNKIDQNSCFGTKTRFMCLSLHLMTCRRFADHFSWIVRAHYTKFCSLFL